MCQSSNDFKLLRFLTQIFDNFSGSSPSTGLNNCFANSLLNVFTKPVWMFLHFFCCSSNANLVLFKQCYHITFKLRLIVTLKYLCVFKHTTLLIYCFQNKWNLACFFGPVFKHTKVLQFYCGSQFKSDVTKLLEKSSSELLVPWCNTNTC